MIVLGTLLLLIAFYYCLRYCNKKCTKKKCLKRQESLKKMLFYDAFIRFVIEGNLDICYENIFFVHLYASFDSEEEAWNTSFRIFFVAVIGFWQIFSFFFIICRQKDLKQEDVEERFGAMYEDIDVNRKVSALYTTAFCFRRLCIVVALLFLQEYPFWMIYSYMLIFSANFCYLVEAMANHE